MAHPALKEVYVQLKTRMDKAVEDFRREMAATRTGRANVHMLDTVSVDYYGSQMPLNQIAQIHAPEPQMITVQPFDPSQLAAIEKAIRSADLGLNPMNDGKLVRVPVPALTEERRKDMVKHLHRILEEHRTAIRNVRRDGNEAIKKALKDKKIYRRRREARSRRNPEAHRRRNQEDGRDEQSQRKRSVGVQVEPVPSCQYPEKPGPGCWQLGTGNAHCPYNLGMKRVVHGGSSHDSAPAAAISMC
jgi:ribosome recycling factor